MKCVTNVISTDYIFATSVLPKDFFTNFIGMGNTKIIMYSIVQGIMRYL